MGEDEVNSKEASGDSRGDFWWWRKSNASLSGDKVESEEGARQNDVPRTGDLGRLVPRQAWGPLAALKSMPLFLSCNIYGEITTLGSEDRVTSQRLTVASTI